MKIVPLSPEHASTTAQLHIAGQPGTFLTNLGPRVLTALYRALPHLSTCFGFAALATEEAETPIGFVAATTSTGGLFLELGTREAHRFFPPLLLRLLQKPTLIGQALRTITYPLLHGDNGDNSKKASPLTGDNSGDNGHNSGQTAELLAIMIDPRWRGRGVGTLLLQQLHGAARARQLGAMRVTVDASNSGARRFYARHGYVEQQRFQLYGRTMCSYRLSAFTIVP